MRISINQFRTTPHIAHFFPVGMSVRAEVCEATRAHDVFFVVDENGERNVVYTDNKYVSKQVRSAITKCKLFSSLQYRLTIQVGNKVVLT